MNQPRTWLAVYWAMLAMIGCNPEPHEPDVVAIEKTKTYHKDECSPVHMAKTERMTLSAAKARNLRPCPLCLPDSE